MCLSSDVAMGHARNPLSAAYESVEFFANPTWSNGSLYEKANQELWNKITERRDAEVEKSDLARLARWESDGRPDLVRDFCASLWREMRFSSSGSSSTPAGVELQVPELEKFSPHTTCSRDSDKNVKQKDQLHKSHQRLSEYKNCTSTLERSTNTFPKPNSKFSSHAGNTPTHEDGGVVKSKLDSDSIKRIWDDTEVVETPNSTRCEVYLSYFDNVLVKGDTVIISGESARCGDVPFRFDRTGVRAKDFQNVQVLVELVRAIKLRNVVLDGEGAKHRERTPTRRLYSDVVSNKVLLQEIGLRPAADAVKLKRGKEKVQKIPPALAVKPPRTWGCVDAKSLQDFPEAKCDEDNAEELRSRNAFSEVSLKKTESNASSSYAPRCGKDESCVVYQQKSRHHVQQGYHHHPRQQAGNYYTVTSSRQYNFFVGSSPASYEPHRSDFHGVQRTIKQACFQLNTWNHQWMNLQYRAPIYNYHVPLRPTCLVPHFPKYQSWVQPAPSQPPFRNAYQNSWTPQFQSWPASPPEHRAKRGGHDAHDAHLDQEFDVGLRPAPSARNQHAAFRILTKRNARSPREEGAGAGAGAEAGAPIPVAESASKELERQALDEYQSSDENFYRELERQAEEQYEESSDNSGRSENSSGPPSELGRFGGRGGRWGRVGKAVSRALRRAGGGGGFCKTCYVRRKSFHGTLWKLLFVIVLTML